MIDIKLIEIGGFRAAMMALRLPHKGKGDTHAEGTIQTGLWADATNVGFDENDQPIFKTKRPAVMYKTLVAIGEKDLKLSSTLVKASDCEAKVMRGINIWLQISAPVYWWCEMETYRAGRERLCSESTMHVDCKGLTGEELQEAKAEIPMGKMLTKVDMFSYQCLRNIWIWRHKHRLQEWRDFCKFIETLPFADELILYGLNREEND